MKQHRQLWQTFNTCTDFDKISQYRETNATEVRLPGPHAYHKWFKRTPPSIPESALICFASMYRLTCCYHQTAWFSRGWQGIRHFLEAQRPSQHHYTTKYDGFILASPQPTIMTTSCSFPNHDRFPAPSRAQPKHLQPSSPENNLDLSQRLQTGPNN